MRTAPSSVRHIAHRPQAATRIESYDRARPADRRARRYAAAFEGFFRKTAAADQDVACSCSCDLSRETLAPTFTPQAHEDEAQRKKNGGAHREEARSDQQAGRHRVRKCRSAS